MGVRSWIYNRTLLPLTTGWYREVIDRLPHEARLLDIGIGTGGALANNAALVQERGLEVTGVDIDEAYVRAARGRMGREGLRDRVEVRLESIYDHQGGPYDAAYFSASFMLMPDPPAVLTHVADLLGDDGRVFFTQTFQERRSPVVDRLKPMLKQLTTVDFGQVTYEGDFFRVLDAAGFEVLEHESLGGGASWSYRLVVARPRPRGSEALGV